MRVKTDATADIFGKCLHTYLIKDAIRDGNVLGFSVEYLNTFDTLKDNIDEEYVTKIDENEIWMADDRLKKVAQHLVVNHHKKTRNQKYTSIFTVQSIPMAIKYYKVFKEMREAVSIILMSLPSLLITLMKIFIK